MTRTFLACCLVSSTMAVATAQDMPLTQILPEVGSWELVADGLQFSEGPAVDAAGRLYFSDVRGSKIYRVDAAGQVAVFVDNSHNANGLMFGPDGRLYACERGTRQVVAFDEQGEATPIARDVEPNDLVVLSDGRIYFTEPATQRVWLVDAAGQQRVVAEGIERPNGVVAWPDEQTLVVADTRTRWLWTFRIELDGSLTCRDKYYELRCPEGSTESGADGMTVDRDGRLYVASRVGLQVFDPTGRLCGVLLKPQPGPLSNVVFAGPDLKTLYVTAGDKVFSRPLKVPGIRYSQPIVDAP